VQGLLSECEKSLVGFVNKQPVMSRAVTSGASNLLWLMSWGGGGGSLRGRWGPGGVYRLTSVRKIFVP
jgi:hypothetical protein